MHLVDYVNDELVAEEQYKEILETRGLEAATRRLLWLFDDTDRQFSLLYRFEFLQEIEEKWIQENLPTNDTYEKLCLSLIHVGRQFDGLADEIRKYSMKLMLSMPAEREKPSVQEKEVIPAKSLRYHHFHGVLDYKFSIHKRTHSQEEDNMNEEWLSFYRNVFESFKDRGQGNVLEPTLVRWDDSDIKKSFLINVVDTENTHAYSAVVGGNHKILLYSNDPIAGELSRNSNKLKLRNVKAVDVVSSLY